MSRVEGISPLRRKLKRVEPETKKEITDVVEWALRQIELDALGFVPVDTGDLAHSIEIQLSKREGVSGLVGPSAKAAEIVRRKSGSPFGAHKYRLNTTNKRALMEFFKGYWVEFGTKGNKDIPPQPARPFMRPAYEINRERIRIKVKHAVDLVLRRIGGSRSRTA